MIQIVRLSKSTLSPDEDLQCAVETSRSYQSDNRETKDKTKPFRTVMVLVSFFVAATEESFGARIVCCRRSDSKELIDSKTRTYEYEIFSILRSAQRHFGGKT